MLFSLSLNSLSLATGPHVNCKAILFAAVRLALYSEIDIIMQGFCVVQRKNVSAWLLCTLWFSVRRHFVNSLMNKHKKRKPNFQRLPSSMRRLIKDTKK